jgi:hypothetical protein
MLVPSKLLSIFQMLAWCSSKNMPMPKGACILDHREVVQEMNAPYLSIDEVTKSSVFQFWVLGCE